MTGKSVNRKDNDREHQYHPINYVEVRRRKRTRAKLSGILTLWRHSRQDSTNNGSALMTFEMVE